LNTLNIRFYFQKKNSKSQHFTWGIRMGMMIFLIGLLIGVYLMILNSHAIGTNEKLLNQAILDKSKHGNFKIPFFLGIHGLQIIPLLSYYFFQNKN
jgi:hypothetical protein